MYVHTPFPVHFVGEICYEIQNSFDDSRSQSRVVFLRTASASKDMERAQRVGRLKFLAPVLLPPTSFPFPRSCSHNVQSALKNLTYTTRPLRCPVGISTASIARHSGSTRARFRRNAHAAACLRATRSSSFGQAQVIHKLRQGGRRLRARSYGEGMLRRDERRSQHVMRLSRGLRPGEIVIS